VSKIVDLKKYDLVFTTSFECPHGVSGHLYEMIDYFYICSTNNINSCILLTDTTSKELFALAVKEKYNFTEQEFNHMLEHTIECPVPKIIMANNICVVDGSWRFGSCVIYTDNIFLLRCSEVEFERFHNHKTIKQTHLMQDFNLYPERFEQLNINVVHYIKKILWSKYKQPKQVKTNTALFYLTTNCRALPPNDIEALINKHEFEHYLVVTNDIDMYASLEADDVSVVSAPVSGLFEKFDAYIYTATPLKADCSPRFIVECAVYNKDVIYEIDYMDPGVKQRQIAIERDVNELLLVDSDDFVSYVKRYIDGN
jgi:hypothetical protein